MKATSLPPTQTPTALLAFGKAVADPLRLDVLRLLKDNSFGVFELCHITTTPQSGMSHHLKILTAAGLLETKREGTSIFYRRAMLAPEDSLNELTRAFLETLDDLKLSDALEAKRREVYDERSHQSAEFFKRCAADLQENQELITSYAHYAGCVGDLIGNEKMPQSTRVLEIGAGDSPLLKLLCTHFKSVMVVDNAEPMLNKTRALAEHEQLTNVSFLLEDYERLNLDFPADLLVCNMVLHHLPSPSAFFQTAAELLAPSGRLLLVDLCPHQQDWARDICGDLWLGFEPVDLDQWAESSGFLRGQSAFLGLKNGFQIQLRIFNKH